jgi:hypothetical protein
VFETYLHVMQIAYHLVWLGRLIRDIREIFFIQYMSEGSLVFSVLCLVIGELPVQRRTKEFESFIHLINLL